MDATCQTEPLPQLPDLDFHDNGAVGVNHPDNHSRHRRADSGGQEVDVCYLSRHRTTSSFDGAEDGYPVPVRSESPTIYDASYGRVAPSGVQGIRLRSAAPPPDAGAPATFTAAAGGWGWGDDACSPADPTYYHSTTHNAADNRMVAAALGGGWGWDEDAPPAGLRDSSLAHGGGGGGSRGGGVGFGGGGAVTSNYDDDGVVAAAAPAVAEISAAARSRLDQSMESLADLVGLYKFANPVDP